MRAMFWQLGWLLLLPMSYSLSLPDESDLQLNNWATLRSKGRLPPPGPVTRPSVGRIWPKPQTQTPDSDIFFTIEKGGFDFQLNKFSSECDIIQQAVLRYKDRFFSGCSLVDDAQLANSPNDIDTMSKYRGAISKLEIVLDSEKGCEKYPYHQMNEQYEIKVDTPDEPNAARIIAISVWGILRGLESFSQLLYAFPSQPGVVYLNRTQILDFPRFTFRGVMLDSSRHFLSKKVIMQNLDLMEMNKFNVFHWHLTDDHSFPYESIGFPALSAKGAFRQKTHVYSQEVIKEVIEAARIRGIRVIPEFDTPGHTQSWELGQPGLLTKCNGSQLPELGPMNPIKPELFDFLKAFFKEIFTVFPDWFVHIGGDEVDHQCWQSNDEVRQFMTTHNITNLESYFIETLFTTLDTIKANKTYLVWQEVLEDEDKIKPDTIIEVWKGNWENMVNISTSKGYQTILASPWYLNYISYGSDWNRFYLEDPQAFGGSLKQQQLVTGGEACMWGEYVNTINLLPRLWPRASAVAERLWSSKDTRNLDEAGPRISEQECRMLIRGYPVQPATGPSYCNVDWANFM